MLKKRTRQWRAADFKVEIVKHSSLGALLELPMFRKCTRLWRKARFEVKIKM